AAREQGERERHDPIVGVLGSALGDLTGKLRTEDAYRIAGIEPGKATQDQYERIGAAMRKLGWERMRKRFDGDLGYAYVRGEGAERDHELEVAITGTGVQAKADVSRKGPRP